MNTNSSLSHALESDFRAMASRSRAAEMKRLWQTLWQAFARTPQTREPQTGEPDTSFATAVATRRTTQVATNDGGLQQAA